MLIYIDWANSDLSTIQCHPETEFTHQKASDLMDSISTATMKKGKSNQIHFYTKSPNEKCSNFSIDRQGYDRSGYHALSGFNKTGYSVDGDFDQLRDFDEDGFDTRGFDRAGLMAIIFYLSGTVVV